MAMQKTEVVSLLTKQIKESTGVYFGDFTGVDVGTVTTMRANFRKKGIHIKVAKNTLIRRSLADCGITGYEKILVGPTMVIFADNEDPMAPAKLLAEFYKTREGVLPMKAIHIDGQQYPGSQLTNLAKMPGKRELQAGVVSLALGPGAQVIGLFKGPGAKVAGQIKALVERLGGE